MTKKELTTGDIIVTRAGYLGVILKEEGYILYQEIGTDWLDDFTERLMFKDNDRDSDIMEVFRDCSFVDVDEVAPLWTRYEKWHRPTVLDRRRQEKKREQARQKKMEEKRKYETELSTQAASNTEDRIYVISQYFYGNRTGTEVFRDRIDYFIRGHLGNYCPSDIADVNRKTILVPGTDNIVIVYDQTQEDHYVSVKFPAILAEDGDDYKARWGEEMKIPVSCDIPEMGLKLHTRCFACRIDEHGVLQSIQDEDIVKFIRYFPAR